MRWDEPEQGQCDECDVPKWGKAEQSRLFISNDDTIRTALERDNDDDASVDV